MKLDESIFLAKKKLGLKYFENLDIKMVQSKEPGLKVSKKGNKVSISYHELVELFRALTLIKEKDGQDFKVVINKRFEKDGYMIDCSRNGVVNLTSLKEIVLIEALMGQNRLLLYTEDTYKLDKYPYFGYLRGGYTKDEIKEVVDFAEGFGVTLIPCIQTLGHLTRPLHWDPMIPLRDGPSTLLIDDEKTYEFIEEMIKFSRECFKSKEIHIGMDESTEIGNGRYRNFHKDSNRVEMFCRHLDRVISICNKYKFSPMIWSDMFFRLNTKDEEYYREKPLPKSTLKLIPKGVELVYWDYYHSEKEVYDRMNKFHKETGRKISFAGGSWRWKGLAPSIQGSFKHSIPAIESCVDNKIKFVFVTAWGDNGNDCSIFTTLPVLALYSTADYFSSTDKEKINSLLVAISGQTLDDFFLMDLPDMPDNKVLIPQYNPSKYFLYQDVMNGMFDCQVKPNFKDNYKKHAETLLKASKNSRDYGYVYKTLSLLCEALAIKVDMGVKLRAAYKANNKKEMVKIVREIPKLVTILNELNAAHREQWFKENKQSGFDVIDGRSGFTINRLLSVKKLVEDYAKGKLEKLDELENEILPYNGHDYEICWNWWETTVTTQNL